jgi:hypothetical protein
VLLLLPDRLEHLVDPGNELEALDVQELELFLDPQAEGRTLAVAMFQQSPPWSRT